MAWTKLQATQTVLHDILSEIGNTADEQLDSLFDKINTALKVPGQLSLGTGLVVNVSNTTITKPNGVKVKLALGDIDIGGLSGSIDFANGTTVTGDVQTVTLPTMTANQWYKAGFEIRSDKKIYVVFGAIGASESLAGFPNWSEVGLSLGYVSLQVNSGGTAFQTPSIGSINQVNGANGQLSDHALLNNRSIANQHPSTAISTVTSEFNGTSLSTIEDQVQKAILRLASYLNIMTWQDGKTYRVGNTIKTTGTGGDTLWTCIEEHVSSTSFDESKFILTISGQFHNTLEDRNVIAAHPTGSINTATPSFTDFFRAAEDDAQKAFNRVNSYSSVWAYNSSNTYRINNVVIHNGSLWRCTVDDTTGTFNESNWVLVLTQPDEEEQTVTNPVGQSVFTLSTLVIPTATKKLMVFVNGVYQRNPTHYSVTIPSTVTFTSTLPQNAEVIFRLN